MSCFHIRVIIATTVILQVSPQTVDISPKYIITDVGTESATFTCNVNLSPVSPIAEHWINWDHGSLFTNGLSKQVAYNDTVIEQDKYSLHGMSSIASNSITQSLTVHGIEEDDNGICSCSLYISGDTRLAKYSFLIVRNVIAPVACHDFQSETGRLTLACNSIPADPPIILQWIDKDGNVLAQERQPVGQYYTNTILLKIPIETLYEGERFTCVATSSGSITTQECIGIGRQRPTDGSIRFSFTYNQTTVGVAATTKVVPITSNSNDESGYLTSPLTPPPVSYSQYITTVASGTIKGESVHMQNDSETPNQNPLTEFGTSPSTSPVSYNQNITTEASTATNAENDSETPNQSNLPEEILLVIIIVSVISMISIVINVVLLYIIIMRKKQPTDNTRIAMEPYYITSIRQQNGSQEHLYDEVEE